MNWQQLATPPDINSDSLWWMQYEYSLSMYTDNEFIGLLNILFDLEWEVIYGYQA